MLQFFEAVIRMTSALSSFSWSSFEFLHIMLEMQSGVVSIIVGICVRFPGLQTSVIIKSVMLHLAFLDDGRHWCSVENKNYGIQYSLRDTELYILRR